MSVVSDSFLGVFLPTDIKNKIKLFINKEQVFPYIRKDEIIGIFFLFGKENKVNSEIDRLIIMDLIKRTINQITQNIKAFYNDPNKTNSEYVREEYMKRVLQISVDLQNKDISEEEVNDRIYFDPNLLLSCFTQHVSYYKQDFFFEVFQPLKQSQLPSSLRKQLEGRMLLLGYNVKDKTSIPNKNTFEPFISWLINSG